ncbi:hypothetical protein QE152_g40582 [Popillia japonica]|uniref:Retrovirus-related Pol polyprotein from transposon TNT 1-94 n=1 Tax=Popillia japonica TaxID=7064 RepID=A0AAW1HFW1_POPJA
MQHPEQYSRINNLRIFGLPENDSEDTNEIVRNLCREKLNIALSSSEIDISHRLRIAKKTQELTTAKGIIDTLEGIYSKKGISTQVQLQRKLRSLRFVEGTSLNIFLTEFQQTICELKGAGGRIEESEIISQLLSAMPESYQAVTTALDVMFCQDETKVTLELFKSKLLMEESRRNKTPETETRNEVAFQSPRQETKVTLELFKSKLLMEESRRNKTPETETRNEVAFQSPRQRNNITWKKKNLPASSSKQGKHETK